MKYEEVTEHLNKIARIDLKNNKKKICWIYIDSDEQGSNGPPKKVSCVDVPTGKKFIGLNKAIKAAELKPFAKTIAIKDIVKIRSSKE